MAKKKNQTSFLNRDHYLLIYMQLNFQGKFKYRNRTPFIYFEGWFPTELEKKRRKWKEAVYKKHLNIAGKILL